jgi:signal transduction histidine kinase
MEEETGREAACAAGPREDTLGTALDRILSIPADERALRRLLGALADAAPAVDSLILAVHEGERLEPVETLGFDAPVEADALVSFAGRVLRENLPATFATPPGPPFPPATRAAAAAPFLAGESRGVLLAGTRGAGSLDEDALRAVRLAADRAALALERGRLERALADALEVARRAEHEMASRRKAVDFILGVVGHDLRNPLGAIHMSASLLQTRGKLEGWQARAVERLRSSAGRMNRIIADLLSYTRTRLGHGIPVNLRQASLEPVVRKAVDELAAVNAGRVIEVTFEGDASGTWDPDRLEQVASNLVSNAVDHGDPDTPVRVRVRGEPGVVVLTVSNSGPGIPPEVLAHLFEPFSRGPEATSRKSSGLGLGLFIAREIVRSHGGQVTASGGPETTVTVRLPRTPAPSPDPGGPGPQP